MAHSLAYALRTGLLGNYVLFVATSALLAVTPLLFYACLVLPNDALGRALMRVMSAVSAEIATVLVSSFGLAGICVVIAGAALAGLIAYALHQDLFSLATRLKAIHYEWWVRITCKQRFMLAQMSGSPKKTILFYPDVPKYYYILYTISHALGYSMTNDPSRPADIAVAFKDITVRAPDSAEEKLRERYRLINGGSRDISKEKVEEVFRDVFGYGMRIDPRTFHGECVQKSNENATHDGKVVQCPREPEAGYVYQKLVDNRVGDDVYDIRAEIAGQTIPFVLCRTRSIRDRFDNTETARIVETREYLSEGEVGKVLLFCKKIGLEWGELDLLRDRNDGKLYVVDANNTTGGPQPGVHFTYGEFEAFVERLSRAFERAFASHTGSVQ